MRHLNHEPVYRGQMMVLVQDQLGVLGEIVAPVGSERLGQHPFTKGLHGEISDAFFIERAIGHRNHVRAGQGEPPERDKGKGLERFHRAADRVLAFADRSARGVHRRNGLSGGDWRGRRRLGIWSEVFIKYVFPEALDEPG